MFQIIDNLRKKPEHSRKVIALIFTSFIVGIIFIVWFTTLFTRLSLDVDQKSVEDTQKIKPIETLFKQTKNIFYGGIDFINGLGKPIKYNQTDIEKDALSKPDFIGN